MANLNTNSLIIVDAKVECTNNDALLKGLFLKEKEAASISIRKNKFIISDCYFCSNTKYEATG